jgi:hypothetical protein
VSHAQCRVLAETYHPEPCEVGGFLHAGRLKTLSLLELVYDGFLAPQESSKCAAQNLNLDTNPRRHAAASARQLGRALPLIMLRPHPGVPKQAISTTAGVWHVTSAGLLVRRRSLHQSGRSSKIVHRLAVFDKSGDVQHIISQSDVIRCWSPRCRV